MKDVKMGVKEWSDRSRKMMCKDISKYIQQNYCIFSKGYQTPKVPRSMSNFVTQLVCQSVRFFFKSHKRDFAII